MMMMMMIIIMMMVMMMMLLLWLLLHLLLLRRLLESRRALLTLHRHLGHIAAHTNTAHAPPCVSGGSLLDACEGGPPVPHSPSLLSLTNTVPQDRTNCICMNDS
jgi:hypothetical protein